MKKQYGAGWQSVFYGLANKRAGRGARGAHRMHGVASSAYAKGSHWGGRGKSSRRGHSVSVRTRGRASVTHRSGGAHIHVRVH